MIFVNNTKVLFLFAIFSAVTAMQQQDGGNNGRQFQLLPVDFRSSAMRAINRGNIQALGNVLSNNNAVMQVDNNEFGELLQYSEDIEERTAQLVNAQSCPRCTSASLVGITALTISTGAIIAGIPVTVLCANWGCEMTGWACIGGIFSVGAVGTCAGMAALYRHARDMGKLHTIVNAQPEIRRLIQQSQEDHASTGETATSSSEESSDSTTES